MPQVVWNQWYRNFRQSLYWIRIECVFFIKTEQITWILLIGFAHLWNCELEKLYCKSLKFNGLCYLLPRHYYFYFIKSIISLGNFEIARKLCFESNSIFKKLDGDNNINTIETYHILGYICYQSKEYDLAIEYLDQCLEEKKLILGEAHI